jgi:hypothetical protein
VLPAVTAFAWPFYDFAAELPDRAFRLFQARAPPV